MKRALALLLVAACGGRAAAPATTKPAASQPAAIDREAAAAELRTSILDGYRLLGSGYDNVYLEGLAHDDRLVLFGVGPEDVLVGFDPRAATLRAPFAGEPYQLTSKNLRVTVATDGSCAWSSDDVSYRVVRDGRRGFFALRSTAFFERREGRWLKVMEHLSYDAPPDSVARMAGRVDAPLPPLAPTGDLADAARTAVTSLVVHPDPAQLGDGASAEITGLRVNLVAGGTVVWAAASLRVTTPRGSFDGRGTFILEATPATGLLRAVQTHLSIPVTDAALADAAFGVSTPSAPR